MFSSNAAIEGRALARPLGRLVRPMSLAFAQSFHPLVQLVDNIIEVVALYDANVILNVGCEAHYRREHIKTPQCIDNAPLSRSKSMTCLEVNTAKDWFDNDSEEIVARIEFIHVHLYGKLLLLERCMVRDIAVEVVDMADALHCSRLVDGRFDSMLDRGILRVGQVLHLDGKEQAVFSEGPYEMEDSRYCDSKGSKCCQSKPQMIHI